MLLPKVKKDSLWLGARGEWYLVIQACLFLLLIFGPSRCHWLPEWRSPYTWIGSLAGACLLVTGILLAVYGTFSLGSNLTPLPHPKDDSTLIVSGAYRLVRHPIYSGITFMAFGWSLWLNSWLTVGYTLLILGFFDLKSRFEERLLTQRFQEYAAYQKRVRKLLPFIY
jgi:protein-S-isoprenylcysteine O-methyltransferase Ste14